MEWRLILGGPAGPTTGPVRRPGAAGAGSDGPSGAPDGPFAYGGAVNMAVDQALLEGVRNGDSAALRLYRWSVPCLSLGRNQRAHGRLDPAAAGRRGVGVVRRPTGGGAVLHDRELTYAVALPVGPLGGPRETYRAINRALVAGLRRLGVAAGIAGEGADGGTSRSGVRRAVSTGARAGAGSTGAPPGPDGAAGGAPREAASALDGPCFAAAAPGEVVAGGRKLVGSAQRRERRALLQHGSILLGGDQRVVAELLGGEVSPPTASLEALLGRVPDDAELISALRSGFEDELGVRFRDAAGEPEPAVVERLTGRFRSDAWTWRR